ncbi:MAG: four helix bundle protein [Deltaproteobacteria bacterium]
MSALSNEKFGYEKLDVWQEAIDWACKVISKVDCLETPRNHYRLVEQLEAAAASVSMNIAEGKGRFSKREFVHYLYIARGSLYETSTLLEIFCRLRWFDEVNLRKISEHAVQIGKMLNSLINSIKKP